MIAKHWFAFRKPNYPWKGDRREPARKRFEDETRHVRLLHTFYDWAFSFMLVRIAHVFAIVFLIFISLGHLLIFVINRLLRIFS